MRTFLFVIFVFCLASFCDAQVVGEIFDKDFANQEFGEVISLVEVENEKLYSILQSAEEYIMLNIESGKLRAIDSNRESIIGYAVSAEEVFYKVSKNQVELLIEMGGKNSTKFEMRPKTLTLTNGNFTLEKVEPCPPFCG